VIAAASAATPLITWRVVAAFTLPLTVLGALPASLLLLTHLTQNPAPNRRPRNSTRLRRPVERAQGFQS